MKIKKAEVMMLAAALCLSAASCGNSGNAQEKTDSEVTVSVTDTTQTSNDEIDSEDEKANNGESEIIETEATSNIGNKAEPLSEIVEADFASGYIQVNGLLLRCGGYITVEEFLEKYGSHFNTDEITGDIDKAVDEDWFFRYHVYYGDEENEMDVVCAPPVSGKGTVKDAVIVMFSPIGEDECIWYPTGVHKLLTESEDTEYAKQLFENNGLTYVEAESVDADGKTISLEDRLPIEDNIGKYSIFVNEKNSSTTEIGNFQLSEHNLYGFQPMISLEYLSWERGNSLSYHQICYNDGSKYTRGN